MARMRWTPDDDEDLLARVEVFRDSRGRISWEDVAKPWRVSREAARKRYEILRARALAPNAESGQVWREDEDKRLLGIVEKVGKPICWAEVTQLFGGSRSMNSLRKRYYALTRGRAKTERVRPTPLSPQGGSPWGGAQEIQISGAIEGVAPYLQSGLLAPRKVAIVQTAQGGDSRVTVTANIVNADILKAIEDFWRDFEKKHHIQKRKPQAVVRDTGEALGVLAPADVHIGKLIWGQSTGEDYDVDIACDKFVSHVERLADMAVHHVGGKLRWMVLVLGNDFFNINSHEFFETANGTPQKQEDSRVQRTWSKARSAAIQAIEACCGAAEDVQVVFVPGNHERDLLYYFGEMLAAWFHDTPGVTIENSPRLRKYVMYGNVLLGFTHGSEEKFDSLPLIMASECPELWGAAKYREWLVGHFHRRREMRYMPLMEQGGVTIRVLPPLTATDQWHYLKGFVGNVRASQAILYNTTEGIPEAVFTVI